MTDNVQWNFEKKYRDNDNIIVTNNVIDFVKNKIEEKTKKTWASSITHNELSRKISLAFSRRQSEARMTPEKKALRKKHNLRKNRRITVCLFILKQTTVDVYKPFICRNVLIERVCWYMRNMERVCVKCLEMMLKLF